jgi:DNA-binding transcriptional regulator GbsR (MarR family)
MDIKNIEETKKLIKSLMDEIEAPGCENKRINELKDILEKIGKNSTLYAKYQDIYSDAADTLMFAGVTADQCSCDPLRKHTPIDKT